MSDSQALRILVITSRPLVTVEVVQENGKSVVTRRPITLKPINLVRRQLEKALRDARGAVAVRYLARATPPAVQTALLDVYDVVHFVGHGAEDGRLLLEGEDATADLLALDRATVMLRGCQARLVVISACHSGKAAQALRDAGIANVVAVDGQLPIADRAAALFNQLFYGALLGGRTLTDAFQQGVASVQADNEVGDHHPPLDEHTGGSLPTWSSRFQPFFSDEHPLVTNVGSDGYQEMDAWTVPTNLPYDREIIGREALMTDVVRVLADARMVTLSGPGGIGKTTVALEVARWYADRELFRDGVFFTALENVSNADRLAEALATALQLQLDPTDPWKTLYTALARKEMLLLLDNAESLLTDTAMDEASPAGRLNQLLASVPDLKLLVTSREAVGLRRWERTLTVEELGPHEAVRLFFRAAPAGQAINLALSHDAEVREICRTLENYPLAVVIAAAQLTEAGMTPERLLRDVRSQMLKVLNDERSRGVPARLRSVRASLDLSYQRLSDRACVIFFYLGVLPGGASGQILAQLVGKRYEPAAQELVARNLAVWENGRYSLLAPIRAYAVSTRPPARLGAAQLRAARRYAAFTRAMDDFLRPETQRQITEQCVFHLESLSRGEGVGPPSLTALSVLDAERINLLASVHWAFAENEWRLTQELVANLNMYLNLRFLWEDMVAIGKLAVMAAQQEANRSAEGMALINLGVAYETQGRREEALKVSEQSLVIFQELEDWRGEGMALNNLGIVYKAQGLWKKAFTVFTKSFAIHRELRDRFGEGVALNNLGMVYEVQEQWPKSIEAYRQSLAIKQELGDKLGEGRVLNNLGNVSYGQGRWEESIAAYKQSLAICQELGDRQGEERILNNLGVVYQSQGQWEEALTVYEQSLAMVLDLHFYPAIERTRTLVDAAKDLFRMGAMADAAQFGQRMLAVIEQKNAVGWKGEDLRALGQVSQQVFAVVIDLGLAANLSAKERREAKRTLLERAKQLDEVTQNAWELEAWVTEVLGKKKRRKVK